MLTSIKKIIKNILGPTSTKELISSHSAIQSEGILFELMREKMISSVLSNRESGIESTMPDGECYVVSLTTHGRRIERVFQTVESIFNQSKKANKVVLYLSKDEFKEAELPLTLQMQIKRGLEIRYVKDIRAYTKLIPALHDFPEANIITVDDDHIYPFDMIDLLSRCHHRYPKSVCCRVSREMTMNGKDSFNTYLTFNHTYPASYTTSPRFLALGYGGVLYPPHSLHPDVVNEELFTKLSPFADDLWYKAMELLQGTAVVQLPRSKSDRTAFEDKNYQELGLWHENIDNHQNDRQIKAIFDHYNLYDALG